MVEAALAFLHREFEKAVVFCNHESKAEDGFPLEEAPEYFTYDLTVLGHYAMCADGEITARKVEVFNELFADYGAETDLALSREVKSWIWHIPFETPKTLIMFCLQAFLQRCNAEASRKKAVTDRNLAFLREVIRCYAVLMCATVTQDTPLSDKELDGILDILQKCCAYVAKDFKTDFTLDRQTLDVLSLAMGDNHE